MTDQDEIARLRNQIADNTARLAALEAKQGRKFVSPPPVERGVTIIEIQASVPCELPDAEQMRQLADIVLRQFPQLAPSYRHGAPRWERDDVVRRWHKGFSAAFTALGAMARLEQPDRRHYAGHFLDHARSWLHSYGISADIGEPFTCAVLAWGDIPWSDFRLDGVLLELGLKAWGGRKANADSWRRVLRPANFCRRRRGYCPLCPGHRRGSSLVRAILNRGSADAAAGTFQWVKG